MTGWTILIYLFARKSYKTQQLVAECRGKTYSRPAVQRPAISMTPDTAAVTPAPGAAAITPSPGAVYCYKCGKKLVQGGNYCYYCGAAAVK